LYVIKGLLNKAATPDEDLGNSRHHTGMYNTLTLEDSYKE